MILELLNLLSSQVMPLPKIEYSPLQGMMIIPIFYRQNILLIYIGDDKTDEDAFKILGDDGLSVLVSEKVRDSHAKYYVKNVDEVMKFLRRIEADNG